MLETKDIELRVRARYEGQKTISEVIKQVDELTAAQEKQFADAKKGTADAKELEATYAKLERSLRQVKSAFDDVRQYERASASIKTLEERLAAAKTKQEAFAASLTKGAELTDAQARKQYTLGAAVERSAAALEKARARAAASGAALQAYGVDIGNLGNEQARLAGLILKGNVALQAQDQAIDKANAAQSRLVNNDVSTALGKIKAQVMGLAAAYVGVQQAAGLAFDSVKAFSDREGVKNQLALSVGNDKATIDAEYEYVKGQADRIGIQYDVAAKGFAKFSAAAAMAGRSRQEIRYMWEAFAEVGRVANLTNEEMGGVFKAIEQMISKGKIQAEELRGQLGERLFGAFQMAAKALKGTYPDLDKALKDGVVTSEQLLAIAEEYRRTVADQLPAAMKSLSAEQARYNNAVLDFKLAIADAGFADAFRKALLDISAALRSEDGKKFAESIAAGFSAVADAVSWLIKNSDQVLATMKALSALWAINAAGNAVKGVMDFGAALKELAANARLAVGAMGLIRGGFAVLQAALVGWTIGTWANEEFETVRKAGIALVIGLEQVWVRIKYGAQILWAELPAIFQDGIASILNVITKAARLALEGYSAAARAFGNSALADTLDTAIKSLEFRVDRVGNASAKLREQMKRDLAEVQRIGVEMWVDAERKPPMPQANAAAIPTDKPTMGKGKPTGPTEQELAKRQRLVDEITRALEALDAKLDRSQTDSLHKQLDAIDAQYAELSRKIAKVGGDTGKEFMAELDASLAQLRAQTIAKFNDGLAAEANALMAKLEQVDAAAGHKSKTNLAARLEAIRTQYESTYREIDSYRAKLAANEMSPAAADSAKTRLDAGIAELQQIETQRFYKDELKRLEGDINNLLATRSERLKTIADQESASIITSADARTQTEQAIVTMQPQLEAMTEQARAFAESLRGAFDPIALDAFIAKLDLAKTSGKRLSDTFEVTGKQIEDMIATRSVQAFGAMAEAIGGAIVHQRTWGDAIAATRSAFLKFAADFLMQIGQMIIKTQIMKLLQGTNWGESIASAIGALIKHDGGLVGAGTGPMRQVSPFTFVGAPRYHAGGIAGLAPGEVPAILQKGEEVLSASNPRNVLNGGTAVKQPSTSAGYRIINVLDPSLVHDFLTSAAGEKVILNTIGRNPGYVKQVIGT